MKRYTLGDVIASYEQKRDWEKQFPVSRYIFRPLSFPLAALLLRFTSSPSAVAWAGLAVGLEASALLLGLAVVGPWPGIICLALFALLDAADGNIARTTGSVTLYGKMLDGMLGKIAEGIYMPALACGLYLSYGPVSDSGGISVSWFTPVAGFTALCASLYAAESETAFDLYKLQKSGAAQIPPPTAKIGSSRYRGNPLYAIFININAFNVQVLLLAAAAAAGIWALVLFVHLISAYYLLRFVVVFCHYMGRASEELS